MITEHEIRYGDDIIRFTLCRSDHAVADSKRKVTIHVHPNGDVQVDAPNKASTEEVKQALQKRARWVLQHRSEALARQQHVLPRCYVSGESVFYLGRRYVLKVLEAADKQVKLVGGQLKVYSDPANPGLVKEQLNAWYRKQALVVFERRLKAVVEKAPWVNTAPNWKLLVMQKQWGSCSPTGLLSLNPHLVKAPTKCIDYVLLHELCHLKEHNHSPEFYRLLSRQMPDWETVKGKLDGMAELILNE
ncbi:M48 family metallopeptidase [Paraneptunicella aestuarii]|uniref:M48 family metallopeptidase n=1 Tax=Paraneptunicella aestuarii TaxID=2831148 RepID=UPI001E548685|nr:SprT family zinc-dependent metalloprotease [Paraneptunicella aestuarii]UAA38581.1 M48 family metallopeptidase [Paraneptunicella aestuarii]